jgi:hypothetical protein
MHLLGGRILYRDEEHVPSPVDNDVNLAGAVSFNWPSEPDGGGVAGIGADAEAVTEAEPFTGIE